MNEMTRMKKTDVPPLDRWRFDAAVAAGPEKLWGACAIAAVLGVSEDTVRRWHSDPANDVPISAPGGRLFAFRSELLAWLRRR